MKKENLERMSDKEIIEYAEALGIPTKAVKAAKNKADFVWKRWNQTVQIEVLGCDFEIPAKALRDKDVTDTLQSNFTDEQATEVIVKLLGDEQYKELVDACTDEDGVVDVVAMAVAFNQIISSEKLKNF